MRIAQAFGAAVLAAGSCALAAASVTPQAVRSQAQAILGSIHAPDLAVFPTRVPARYIYDSYSVTGSPASLNITFADKRFESSSAQLAEHALSFDVSYFRGKRCQEGASNSFRVGGVKLYEDAKLVWRCVRMAHHLVVESAHGRAPRVSLALVVAYARPVT
jgi:hypothetical protein